ncbi:hypothetical protein N7462_001111 [Penicillium macrosclerotiorum]|uniref:uncharacterized protein n=1 Tax=Penicillium macrosclerotiorum TaxID=303699 RepID=UPI002546858D|nr:uncharacterized protein N7462_001111 [Penicillium macrosclerotiorum]KAJ5699106.1 hypothetical protein N7462_001111 [Penicillium macrosclerotiorum]
MRNTGAAVAIAVHWLFVYIVVLVITQGISSLGWRFYLVFAALNVAFVPFIWYFYIETAGLSLEQIDRILEVKFDGGPGMTYKKRQRLSPWKQMKVEKTSSGIELVGHVGSD